ncbi:MAG: hypothetical protein J0L84_02510 [Verrucomicrobia bacterium]|nr:hypothetical protein [Verrucomicrobiota bacterium]
MDSPSSEFPQLTRLLHLKRFEVPPPGFHRRFRARVMTRIDMEREWEALPWWHRALATLTLRRGLAIANGVALAGVAFLGVATFHVAHTVLHEEDEVHTYAALPLPGLPPAEPRDHLIIADASHAAGAIGTVSFPPSVFAASLSEDVGGRHPEDASPGAAAPAWLFDPPSQRARKAIQPKFILPDDHGTSATR